MFRHDPEQYNFKVNDLPALYLFRTGSARKPEQIAEHLRVHADIARIFWVLPTADQFKQADRALALSFVGNLIDSGLRRGRDPSYIVEGDADTTAATEGSVVLRHAGLMGIEPTEWRSGRVAIASPGHMKSEQIDAGLFDCLQMQVTLTQLFQELPGTSVAPASLGPTAEVYFPAALTTAITQVVGDIDDDGDDDPDVDAGGDEFPAV